MLPWQQHKRCHSVSFKMLFVPSLKNTALIILELFSIECCAVLVEPPLSSSLIIQKCKYVQNEKYMPKRKTPFFFTLKSLSHKQHLFFYFIGTLIFGFDPASFMFS